MTNDCKECLQTGGHLTRRFGNSERRLVPSTLMLWRRCGSCGKMADQMVIDANVAAKWFLKDETDVDVADGILAGPIPSRPTAGRQTSLWTGFRYVNRIEREATGFALPPYR